MLGRFLQTDPVGYDDALNWYVYTNNDPLNASDPKGTCGTWVTGSDGNATYQDGPCPDSYGEVNADAVMTPPGEAQTTFDEIAAQNSFSREGATDNDNKWQLPFHALFAKMAQIKATKAASEKYKDDPASLVGGEGDAFRHATGAATMQRSLGALMTKHMLDSHERTNLNSGQPANVEALTAQDIINNRNGNALALANPQMSPDEVVGFLLGNNLLQTQPVNLGK